MVINLVIYYLWIGVLECSWSDDFIWRDFVIIKSAYQNQDVGKEARKSKGYDDSFF